jgi:hypothetical protein
MSQIWTGFETRVTAAQRAIRRASAAPTLVRLVILLAAGGSMLLAARPLAALQLLALLPALFPRTLITTAFILFTFVLWLSGSGIDPSRITLWRVCALAMTLYIVHIGAALAAVLPYDAVLTPGVFRPWIVRVGIVALLTTAVGAFVFLVRRVVDAGAGTVGATVGGFVVLITTVILLAYLGNRRQ